MEGGAEEDVRLIPLITEASDEAEPDADDFKRAIRSLWDPCTLEKVPTIP